MREVCYRTGYLGRPVDWQWYDFESFADMFSGYYTDHEPESALVAEIDGVVSGYLLGCVDTERAASAGAAAAHHIVRRGIAFRRGTAAVVWRTVADALGDVARRRVDLRELEFADPRWPADFHIDLLPDRVGSASATRSCAGGSTRCGRAGWWAATARRSWRTRTPSRSSRRRGSAGSATP